MNKKYANVIFNLVKSSKDLDSLGYNAASAKVLNLAYNLYVKSNRNLYSYAEDNLNDFSIDFQKAEEQLRFVYSRLNAWNKQKYITQELKTAYDNNMAPLTEFNIQNIKDKIEGLDKIYHLLKTSVYQFNKDEESNDHRGFKFDDHLAIAGNAIYGAKIRLANSPQEPSQPAYIQPQKGPTSVSDPNVGKSLSAYVKDLQSGVMYLLKAIPKATGTQRDSLLKKLNTEVKELNRVYRQVTPTTQEGIDNRTPYTTGIQDQITSLMSSIQHSELTPEDHMKMPDFQNRITIFD